VRDEEKYSRKSIGGMIYREKRRWVIEKRKGRMLNGRGGGVAWRTRRKWRQIFSPRAIDRHDPCIEDASQGEEWKSGLHTCGMGELSNQTCTLSRYQSNSWI
jgi:hypothetical protein